MTKEEKIKESYGEYWEKVKSRIKKDEWGDGWLYYLDFKYKDTNTYYEIAKKYGREDHPCNIGFRPKSLKGIENNNGWNTIPSIHEKEIEKGQYWVIYPNGFIEVAYYDGTMECYKFWKLNFTHYQPIEKPKTPLF